MNKETQEVIGSMCVQFIFAACNFALSVLAAVLAVTIFPGTHLNYFLAGTFLFLSSSQILFFASALKFDLEKLRTRKILFGYSVLVGAIGAILAVHTLPLTGTQKGLAAATLISIKIYRDRALLEKLKKEPSRPRGT